MFCHYLITAIKRARKTVKIHKYCRIYVIRSGYKNQLLDRDYPKVQVVSIDEILNGDKMPIPTTHAIAVLKAAEGKVRQTTERFEQEWALDLALFS